VHPAPSGFLPADISHPKQSPVSHRDDIQDTTGGRRIAEQNMESGSRGGRNNVAEKQRQILPGCAREAGTAVTKVRMESETFAHSLNPNNMELLVYDFTYL
jgi:hypothetical protein